MKPGTTADAETRDEKLAKAARLFSVVPYDPDKHGAFVRSTWANGALRDGTRIARARLDGYLLDETAKAVLAHTSRNPDQFAGWAAKVRDELIFAYVIPAVRGRYVANLLLGELGFSLMDLVPLLHWTPSAEEIAANGGRVYFSPRWDSANYWQTYVNAAKDRAA